MSNRAARFLEFSLFAALVVHVIAMFSMALLLMPAMPGAINPDPERIKYIAQYPWLWHLGWLPWHLCALSDVVLALALIQTKWIPRFPAFVTAILTVAAVGVEQPAELMWNIEGAKLAQLSVATGILSPYLDFEQEMFVLVGAVAAVLYAIMAYGWTWCFAASGAWNRFLSWLSAITWTLLLLTGAAPLLPDSIRPSLMLIGVGNAIGFNLMALWFVLVLEAVLRRSRLEESCGRMMPWKHPAPGVFGAALTLLGNSRFIRYVGEFSPAVAMISDIEDVIYINYLGEADKLAALVPEGLELQRLGKNGGRALFTILTYRHGHFGPRAFGPLRKFLPSPVQSNWRVHVQDRKAVQGVFFVSTVVSNTLVSVGGRILSDGVPMHVAVGGTVTAGDGGRFYVKLDGGNGSAPDLVADLSPCEKPVLTDAWQECFSDFDGFLMYCVPQDRVLSSQAWYQQTTKQEIDLGIPLSACEPLSGAVTSNAVRQLVGDCDPICFRVPTVNFKFEKVLRESY